MSLDAIRHRPLDSDQENLQEALFNLSVSLISDAIHLGNNLLFINILGWNSKKNRWHLPGDYTSSLAALIYCIRLIMIEHSVRTLHRSSWLEHYPDEADTPMERAKKMALPFLSLEGGYAFHNMVQMLRFGRRIAGCRSAAAPKSNGVKTSPGSR
jgi:hypothetical protein